MRRPKPSTPVRGDARIEVDEADTWVGRGALKLLCALQAFAADGLAVTGRRCLDVGASTGGFTQVLLHHGAAHVVALDVGHGQLAQPVASDPRVTNLEGMSIRDAGASDLGGPFEVIVADVSFISLRLVVPALPALLQDTGDLVLLVKPQFEVGREALSGNPIVRDPQLRRLAVTAVSTAAREAGFTMRGLIPSPVVGSGGNQEYLGWWSPARGQRQSDSQIERMVASVVVPR